ncbi:hypothetical protein [Aquimarina algiphila]|uniref:hypothetical protein n=1 Tax=Aquimarina algiphila TaxID=2047982 RepID=UPI00232B3DF0|nr:hypothetical protein [Aquimarina algiphila]
MEENNEQSKSIWGKWWIPFRKWFYPVWLVYEVSIRFYEYSLSVHIYFIEQQKYVGQIGAQTLAIFCSIATFVICTFYLTVPACFTLFKLFKEDDLTGSRFEQLMKKFF